MPNKKTHKKDYPIPKQKYQIGDWVYSLYSGQVCKDQIEAVYLCRHMSGEPYLTYSTITPSSDTAHGIGRYRETGLFPTKEALCKAIMNNTID